MLAYPVNLEPDTNGTVLATFPDVPEAHTFGDDGWESGSASKSKTQPDLRSGNGIPKR